MDVQKLQINKNFFYCLYCLKEDRKVIQKRQTLDQDKDDTRQKRIFKQAHEHESNPIPEKW